MITDYRVLLVDDEPNLLNALTRQLRGTLAVETFHQPKVALAHILKPQPCAVVVSDMRMPEMNGIQFLSAVQHTSPDTVRIMLTGNADRDTVTQAVNESNIFRFLTKPCSPQDLAKAIADGIAQYKLITAERDLLQRTLGGSVKLLTDVLALSLQEDFKDVLEKRELGKTLCKELGVAAVWEVELALMLAPIGTIALPPEVLSRRDSPESLTDEQRKAIAAIPATSRKLVSNIPRLERVGALIEGVGREIGEQFSASERPDLGQQIVRALHGLPAVSLVRSEIHTELQKLKAARLDARLVQVLEKLLVQRERSMTPSADVQSYAVKCSELCVGQELRSDVQTMNGKLLIAAGNTLTETLVERIRGYAALVGVKEPIQVNARIPTTDIG